MVTELVKHELLKMSIDIKATINLHLFHETLFNFEVAAIDTLDELYFLGK